MLSRSPPKTAGIPYQSETPVATATNFSHPVTSVCSKIFDINIPEEHPAASNIGAPRSPPPQAHSHPFVYPRSSILPADVAFDAADTSRAYECPITVHIQTPSLMDYNTPMSYKSHNTYSYSFQF